MARNVFFSFHYTRDIARVNQVRNSWRFYPSGRELGYIDHSLWEKSKLQGRSALEKLIDTGLNNTSVTAVLIGAQTAGRPFVQYEIEQSIKRGNGLLGIRIHNLKDFSQATDLQGTNPFDKFALDIRLSGRYPGGIAIYDWKINNGTDNISAWVEAAAKQVGR